MAKQIPVAQATVFKPNVNLTNQQKNLSRDSTIYPVRIFTAKPISNRIGFEQGAVQQFFDLEKILTLPPQNKSSGNTSRPSALPKRDGVKGNSTSYNTIYKL